VAKSDDNLWLWIGLGVLAAVGGTAAVIALTPWQTLAQNNAGPSLYAQLMAWFGAAEQANGIPTNLLARQGYQESSFLPSVINGGPNSAGAVGIMQIIPSMHPGVDPTDPQASINYAGNWMAQLYAEFGSWSLALAAYNAGPGTVTQYGGIPPYPETQAYVSDIIGDLNAAGEQVS
jgi:soluble lytic murein transglycosylase-like protein